MFPGVYKLSPDLRPPTPTTMRFRSFERTLQRDRDDVEHQAHSVPLDLKILRNRYEKEPRWQLGTQSART